MKTVRSSLVGSSLWKFSFYDYVDNFAIVVGVLINGFMIKGCEKKKTKVKIKVQISPG